MARKIVTPVEVQASVTGDQSVKSFRAQLREAQQDALRLAQAMGQTSPAALAAAQRVAELRDQMDDFNHTVAGMHPDKFAVIGKVVGTMANGFAAAQGAAALLGSESEDLQKAMLKVQGAMAFAQGAESLQDLPKLLGGVKKYLLTQLIPAFATTAGAARLVGQALGVGLIITGVTLLIQNFEKIESWVRKIANLPDWDKWRKAQEAVTAAGEKELELMEAMGATEQELFDKRFALYGKEAEALALQSVKRKLSAEEQKRLEDLQMKLAIIGAQERTRQLKAEEAAKEEVAKKEEERAARRSELANIAREKAKEAKDAAIKAEQEYAAMMERVHNTIDERERTLAKQRAQKKQEDRNAAIATAEQKEKEHAEMMKGIAKDIADQKIRREQEVFEHKRTIEQATSANLGALSTLFKEGSAAQKSFALAQIAADTGAAIGGALRNAQSFTFDNAATGGLAGIAKFAAISAIILTNSARAIRIVKGGNGAGSGGSGSPAPVSSGNIPQPSFNSSSLGGGTQFAGGYDNRVYVTEGDITNTQRRVRQNRGVSVI